MTFRLLVSLFIFLCSLNLAAQNTFWGEFEFPSELDLWRGDIDDFIVQNEKLRLYAPDGKNESEIYVPFQFLDQSKWNFTVSMDFSPSGSNYAEFILAKDTSSNNKVFCRIGENGTNDALELFYNSTSIARIDEGDFSNAFQNEKVEIEYKQGDWIITTLRSGIIVNHPVSFNAFNAFSIKCNYSKTRSDLFYFDSLYVYSEAIPDTSGPEIQDIKFNPTGKHSIQFNENINQPESILINGKIPLNYAVTDNVIEFQFNGNKTNIDLEIQLSDKTGNNSYIDRRLQLPFKNKATVLITELMVDPEPTLFLPYSEYIELYNSTNQNISLAKWAISDASENKVAIPKTDLPPGETAVLVPKGNKTLFTNTNKVIELESFPSLNNSTDIITVYDSSGVLVHQVNYNTSVFENLSDGGKSIELINSENACSFSTSTWKESTAFEGGTPGVFTNSIIKNEVPLINGNIVEDTLKVALSPSGSAYQLSNAFINGNELKSYHWKTIDTLELIFKNNIPTGEIINLKLNYLDCQLEEIQAEHDFLIPETLKTGDVIINEYLINGKESIDFIEFINVSNKPILSNQILLTQLKEGQIEKSWKSENSLVIQPNELWVWCPSLTLLTKNYLVKNPEKIHEVKIALTEDIELGLYSSKGVFLDQLNTNVVEPKNWLNTPEDASWERLSPQMESNNSESWAPATELSDWATPTAENTQGRLDHQNKEYEVANRIIRTTSNNPKEQQVEVVFHPNDSKTYINAIVFNRNGQKVKDLVSNRLLASEDRIFWNGKDENNRLLATNIYVLYLEIYSLNGETKVKKESIVID